jgi:hypothetical protein
LTIYSTDGGSTWLAGSVGAGTFTVTGIAFGNGRFVAIGQTGFVRISTDGINWTNGPTFSALNFGDINFYEGEFVAGGVNTSTAFYRSTDGVNWTSSPMPNPTIAIYHPIKVNGRYVAGNANALYWSDDFSTWNLGVTFSSNLTSLTWDGQQMIATGGGLTYTSTDATSWTQIASAPGSVAASPSGGHYIATSFSNIHFSTDLVNWTQFTGTFTSSQLVPVFTNDRFWAVGADELLILVAGPLTVGGSEPLAQATSEITSYVAFNYEEGSWQTGELVRTAWADRSPVLNKPYAAGTDGYLYKHETGVDAAGAAMTASLASYDLEIGMGEELVHVDQLVPDFLELAGSVKITFNGRKYPQATALISKGPYVVQPDTRKISTRMRARQVSVELLSDQVGDRWRMGTLRARAGAHGKRG